jgi:CheY-like chemotaxis protein
VTGLGLQAVLVIDDDEGVRNAIASHLYKLGIPRVDLAEDGEVAWSSITKNSYDLVLTDWKMPGLSGLALANRIRKADDFKNLPILVVTGYLNRADFRLMSEFPLVATLEKPYLVEDLSDVIGKLRAETEFFQKENAAVQATFREFPNDPQMFVTNLISLLNLSPKPVPLAIRGSRLLQDHGYFPAAEKILSVILSGDPECTLALHELGKCYLRQQRYSDAIRVLQDADAQCPQNLERLCLMGKANLNLADFPAASENFRAALRIDGEDVQAKRGLMAAEVAAEESPELSVQALATTFISAVNARAIAKVHSQAFSDALALYDSALAYADDQSTQMKLAFNMGLAFLRWEKPADAVIWFKRSAELSQNQFQKAMRNIAYIAKNYGINPAAPTSESADDETIGQRSAPVKMDGKFGVNISQSEDLEAEFNFDVENSVN